MSTLTMEVVKSVAGHDSGKLYCVISRKDGFALVVNGKTRKLERPKLKKEKHLEPMNIEFTEETENLTDKKIRRLLREIAEKSV